MVRLKGTLSIQNSRFTMDGKVERSSTKTKKKQKKQKKTEKQREEKTLQQYCMLELCCFLCGTHTAYM